MITSRGVKYTHNDHKHLILHSNRGPSGLCVIPQASDPKKVVGDPPTPRHSVADSHAVVTLIHGGRAEGLDPTTTPIGAYGVISVVKANNFGKEFLRMAGIVQMLHRHNPPYDKYPYAHPKRIRATQPARNQTGSSSTVSTTVLGPCATGIRVGLYSKHHRPCVSSIWLIQSVLLTLLVPSITAYLSHNSSILLTVITAWLDIRIQ